MQSKSCFSRAVCLAPLYRIKNTLFLHTRNSLPPATLRCLALSGRKVVSSDSHIVKIWDQQTGVNFTNIEPAEAGINDVCLWKDSGLAMLACDAPKIQVTLA